MKTKSVLRASIALGIFICVAVAGTYQVYRVTEQPQGQADLASLDQDLFAWFERENQFSTAENCTDVNLVADKPHVQQIRNQRATGWCYANAVADVLSFDEGVRVSAVSVADATIQGRREFFERADDAQTIDATNDGAYTYYGPLAAVWDRGYCLESEIKDSALMNLIAVLKQKPEFQEIIKRLKIIPAGDYRPASVKAHEAATAKYLARLDEILVASGYSTSVADRLIEEFVNKNTNTPLKTYVDMMCSKRREVRGAPFKPGQIPGRIWRKPLQALVNPLKMNVQGLAYQANMGVPDVPIRPARVRYLWEAHRAMRYGRPLLFSHDVSVIQASGAPNSGHAVVILGRRWNKERSQCEFLLKNSWGKSSGGYNEKVIPLIGEAFGAGKGDYTGYVWLPERTFLEALQYSSPKETEAAARENRERKKWYFGEVFWYMGPKK